MLCYKQTWTPGQIFINTSRYQKQLHKKLTRRVLKSTAIFLQSMCLNPSLLGANNIQICVDSKIGLVYLFPRPLNHEGLKILVGEMCFFIPVNRTQIPRQVASIKLSRGEAITKVTKPIRGCITEVIIFPTRLFHGFKEMNSRTWPHHHLPVGSPLLEPRTTWRCPSGTRHEVSVVLEEIRNCLWFGVKRCHTFR